MDLLKKCAIAFRNLSKYEYHFIIGRKGKSKEFTINFDDADFHHLAGLHKLKDNARLQYGKRADVLEAILNNKIDLQQLKKSNFYRSMAGRLEPLAHLEEFLDDNHLIFHYNEKIHKYSVIRADYLLENSYMGNRVFLFLGKREKDGRYQMCRTFFPKSEKDYTIGQPQYSLLKKEKINIEDGSVEVQYDQWDKG